jgi:hypothetical protein
MKGIFPSIFAPIVLISMMVLTSSIATCQTSAQKTIDSLSIVAKRLEEIDPDSSLALTLRARQIAMDINDSSRIADMFYRTASIYYFRGSLVRALNDYAVGKRIVEKIDNRLLLAKTFVLAAMFDGASSNTPSMMNNYRKALSIYTELKEDAGRARCLYNLMLPFLATRNVDSAKVYHDQLVILAPHLPENIKPMIQLAIVRFHVANADFQAARSTLAHIKRPVKAAREEGLVEVMYYEMAMHEHNYKQAERHVYNAIAHFRQAKNPGAVYIYGYANLAKVFKAQGRYKEAFDCERQNDEALSGLENLKVATALDMLQAQEEENSLILKQNEIKKLTQQNELQQLKIDKTNATLVFVFIVVVLLILIFILWTGRSQSQKRRQLLEKDLHLAKKEEELSQQELLLLDSEKRALELKLSALRSQMNPHFIFNALNSIQACISDNRNEIAIKYLAMFSKLLRSVLQDSNQPLLQLRKEIETLKLYVGLESLRFGNSIDFDLNVQADLEADQIKVPSFLLQPFIENAVKHAFVTTSKEKRITVRISKSNNRLKYEIVDNGVGLRQSRSIDIEGYRSMGTSLVRDKLAALGDIDCTLEVTDLADHGMKGTRVVIEMPLIS